MSHLKIIEKDNKKSWNFMNYLKPSRKTGFLNQLKIALFDNKFITYAIGAGLSASVINTFYYMSILSLVEWIGAIAGGYALSNAMKGNENIVYKSESQINSHIIKSILLLAVGFFGGEAIMYLPFAHIFKFFTTIVLFAGINGLFESGFEKYRRKN